MNTLRLVLALTGLVIASLSAGAGDLTRIDRSILKEPAYETKAPKYCLLVLGPKAKTRIWLVLDGKTLYVDRNADGDLTAAGERLDGRDGVFKIGELLDPVTGRKHTELIVNVDRRVERSDDTSYIQPFEITGRVRGKYAFTAVPAFADRAKDAPAVPLDGPLTPRIFGDVGLTLHRDRDTTLSIHLIGQGDKAAIYVEYDGIPAEVRPRIDMECSGKTKMDDLVRSTTYLKDRC
jgi:hypothetical protein